MSDWKIRARELSDQLAESRHVRTSKWRAAFAAVPRHEFVPQFFEQGDPGQWQRVDCADTEHAERWLSSVYSNTTLVTALQELTLPEWTGFKSFAVAVSSSTEPGLMAQMLEDLDVQAGHTVLEIGTGTGYNAGLLCERLGDDHVYSVDLRPDQVEAATLALARAGYRPTLAVADGADGLPAHAPYDRIIATCSVRHIPPAWIEQLRPGGKLLTDVEGTMYAGNIADLYRQKQTVVEGRFSPRYGSFMPMQHQLGIEPGHSNPTDPSTTTHRTTAVNPGILHQREIPFGFFAQLHLPTGTQLRPTGTGPRTRLVAPDGSWCEVSDHPDRSGHYDVTEGGPNRLWRVIEDIHERYAAFGNPGWDRFGITATPTGQTVWLDNHSLTWPVPITSNP